MSAPAVVWHDVECGGYREDLPVWRDLAGRAGGPVLDVGAGTGRVALALARDGHEVVALDRDAALLAELERRAAGRVATVCADARRFSLGARRFALVIVPMQTIQLLGGRRGRLAFLRCAQAHLATGGLLGVALADALDGLSEDGRNAPAPPDVRTVGGVVYASHPVGVRDEGDRIAIERMRETIAPDGRRTMADDVVRLDRVDAATLDHEAVSVGFSALEHRLVPETEEYVGSTVVVLRA